MPHKPVRIIVDGAIDLPPEIIHALDIIVIPRTAKLGWTRVELNADFTGYSLAQEQTRPRNTELLLPEKTACITAYQQALAANDDVEIISLHLPPEVDEVANRMRMARNMMPRPAAINVIEAPLMGMGFTWLVEVVARLAHPTWAEWLAALQPGRTLKLAADDESGWTREMITTLLRSFQRHTRSLFITSPKFPYRAKLPAAQRKITVKKPLSATFKSMWALSSSARPPLDDKLGLVGYHYEVAEVVRMVQESLASVAVLPGQAPGARCDTTLRHANMERLFSEMQAALGMVAPAPAVEATTGAAVAAAVGAAESHPQPAPPASGEPSAPEQPQAAAPDGAPSELGESPTPPEQAAPAVAATVKAADSPPAPPPPALAPQAEGFYTSQGWSPAVASFMGREHIELFAAPNSIFLAGLITLTMRVQREFVDQNGHERDERRIWQQVDRLSPK